MRRRLAAGVVLVALLTLVASAHAGVYRVRACDAAAGANNSWEPFATSNWVVTDPACPSGGRSRRGLVARNVISHKSGGRTVGRGTSAGFTFTAPPGTRVVGIRAGYRFYRHDHRWRAFLSDKRGTRHGCVHGPRPCDGAAAIRVLHFPPSRSLTFGIFCHAAKCPVGTTRDPRHGSLQAFASLYSAVVSVRDNMKPLVSRARGSLWTSGWHRGTLPVAFDANDGAGIAALRVHSDSQLLGSIVRRCDFTRPAPCPNGGASFSIDTRAIRSDGAHAIKLDVADPAGNTAFLQHQILIDNTPPLPPVSLTTDGGDRWHRANSFSVSWENPQADGGSPVAAAAYEICPAAGGPCTQGETAAHGISSLTPLSVPGPGQWTLRVWLRDAAGNSDPRAASGPLPLRFDDEAPAAAFMAQDPRNPTQVTVRASDTYSGLASGVIEIKKADGDAWRPLDTQLRNTGLVATIDDAKLPGGVYELRARVLDQAGNETSTATRTDGSPATVTLPLRLVTRLRTGVVHYKHRHGHKRRVLRKGSIIRFGKRVRLGGVLTSRDGTPIAGADILVQRRSDEPGAAWTPAAALKTSRRGRFSYLAHAGPSRVVRFHYAGTSTVRGVNSEVTLRVRARTDLGTNHRRLRNGDSVRFSGHLLGGHIPRTGKLVELQVRLRRRWQTFTTFNSDTAGRWRHDYRFIGTSGTVTYDFRAKIPREATYPYFVGTSRHVRVTVRG